MKNIKININETKTAIANKEPLHLVLQIKKSGILLCAIQAYNNTIVCIKSFEHLQGGADGGSMIAITDFCSNLNIEKCIVGLNENRFMILPNEMKDLDKTINAFSYVHHIENNDILEQQTLAWQDFFGAYLIKNSTKHIFTNWNADIVFANTNISLLQLYQQLLQSNAHQIFISFSNNNFVFTVYKNAKLMLHNIFEMQSIDDVYYQTQKHITQFSLENVAIQINGFNALENFEKLKSYYPLVQIQQLPNGFIYPKQLSKQEELYIIPLLAIAKYANY